SRGSKGEVDRAFGILRSAAIGIFIIFLSGVFVRFTTRALTGGVSKIATVGETCDSATKKSVESGDGLWVSIPAGIGADDKMIPESLECVKKGSGMVKDGKCEDLNAKLAAHGRAEEYACIEISGASNCVRGLCSGEGLGGDFACCLPNIEPK
ncbi:MAG: hypothetical protein AAB554_02080, partial [Patescibacteria group bacterium]